MALDVDRIQLNIMFALIILQGMSLEKRRELHVVIVDLEKTKDHIPRDLIMVSGPL